MKKTRVLLTIASLLSLVLVSQTASNIIPIRAASTTLTVPSDQYPTIQSAINAADPEDTILVAPGMYLEHVVVNKTVKLVGDNRETTIIDGSRTGPVIHITADSVKISGFTIQNASEAGVPSVGVFLATTAGSNITGNIVQTNWVGIYLNSSSSNTVMDNIILNNTYGIYLRQSGHNNFDHNIALDNRYGFVISLHGSGHNVLTNNNMSRNSQNFKLFTASDLSHFVQDIDSSNTVDGRPIYYWMNQRDKQVPSHAGYVAIINSTNITVKDAVLTRNGEGVLFVHTTNSTIDNVNASNNIGGDGIVLHNSSSNYILRSTINNNLGWGIRLDASDDNIILGNKLRENSGGIWLEECINNVIYGNTITNSTAYGIYAWNSEDNKVSYNGFEGNLIQVYSEASSNSWDDGYPSGGNYWSDYTGTDSNGDGIGDTEYIIDPMNKDRYPLMNPPSPIPAFAISLSPFSQNVKPGQSVTYNVTVFSLNSFSSEVHLNGILNPSSNDISFTFSPETVIPPPNGLVQGVLTVNTISTIAPKTFVITVNATNAERYATDTVEITVLDTKKPVADAGPDKTVNEDSVVTLNGSSSYDNVGIINYTWTFIDGDLKTLTGITPDYVFDTFGNYVVTLNVTDAAGNWATDTVIITVLRDADGDGTPDVTDPDDDNDGVADDEDAFPLDASESLDTDGDGLGNNADADDDGDGMPDAWEMENGLNPLNEADASLDPDGDGLTNLQEYLEDTDPNVYNAETFPLWIAGAVATLIGIAVVATLLWRKQG